MKKEIVKLIEESAKQFEVDPGLLVKIIKNISGGDAAFVSKYPVRKGLSGIPMDVWQKYLPFTSGKNPFKAIDSIEVAAKYLSWLLSKGMCNGDIEYALACYHLGYAPVQKLMTGKKFAPVKTLLPKETQEFIKEVTAENRDDKKKKNSNSKSEE